MRGKFPRRQFAALFTWAVLSFGFALSVEAGVRLPALISNGMVLQHGESVRLWGWADPQETVTAEIQGQRVRTVADAEGNWELFLYPLSPGGPYRLTINDRVVEDILIGDVWLCSGQSNMETPVRRTMDLFAGEVSAYENRSIRTVKIPSASFPEGVQEDIPPVEWFPITQEYVMEMSALAYFFAREMQAHTGIPIGIINSSEGGSPIETWICNERIKAFPCLYNDWNISVDAGLREAAAQFNRINGRLWREVLYRSDPGLHDSLVWYADQLDVSGWKTVDVFNDAWSKHEYGNQAGSFWFRQEVELPGRLSGQAAILRVGTLVDADSVFVNGTFVGTTGYQYPPRIYRIPEGLLRAGTNYITVRLIAPGGNARFIRDKPYKIIFGDEEIALESEWRMHRGAVMPLQAGAPDYRHKPSALYNGMIAPIAGYGIRGVIWYQGESNTGRAGEYDPLLENLIGNWRDDWKRGDLPFIVIQLANFMSPDNEPSESGWAEIREAQRRISENIPNVGLAVAIDAGEWNDIHPQDKKTVAHRVALQARKLACGENITADGPVFESIKAENGQLILSFRAGTEDFRAVGELCGFSVAGANGRYRRAQARIEGNRVVVWNEQIIEPVSVRYAWGDNPQEANLYNTAGLPASPFQARTENHKLLTQP